MKNITLTNKNLAEYKQNGFLKYEGLMTKGEVEKIRKHVDEMIAQLPPSKRPEELEMPHINDDFLLGLCFSKEILSIVRAVIREDPILIASHMICKRALDGLAVQWHQDVFFNKPFNAKRGVTIWLAIDESNSNNGCLRVVPGSHIDKKLLPHETSDQAQDAYQHERIDSKYIDDTKAVNIELGVGGISLHDQYILHSSKANKSSHRRCGYTMRFISTPDNLNPGNKNSRPLYIYRDNKIELL